MTPFVLTDQQQVDVTLAFLDATGQSSPVTNATLTAPDATILTITPPANVAGPSSTFDFTLVATGKLGTVTLTATGTNPDGSTVTGTQDVTVSASGAASVTFTFGVPTTIVAPAPAPSPTPAT